MAKYLDITGEPPPFDLGWYDSETGEYLGNYHEKDYEPEDEDED